MNGWLIDPQFGLATLLLLPSKDCRGAAAVVNMLDTRLEMEDATLNMGHPEVLSPPKAEKAKEELQRRSRAKECKQSLDMAAGMELR